MAQLTSLSSNPDCALWDSQQVVNRPEGNTHSLGFQVHGPTASMGRKQSDDSKKSTDDVVTSAEEHEAESGE